MFTLLLTAALAVDPTATAPSSQAVVGTVSVASPADEVRRLLADPVRLSQLDGGTTKVTIRAREGSCVIADYLSPSFLMDVVYAVKQCPTTEGNAATLLSSNAFSSYRTEWKVQPEGAGSLITYRIDIDSSLMVPDSMVVGATKKAVQKLMETLRSQLGAP